MSRPPVAAGALFFDEASRILLVKPTYKEGWDIPGGYVEPGETPVEACRREVAEEPGLEREIGGLLVVDWAPSAHEGDKVLFVFDGGVMSDSLIAQIVTPRQELVTFAFHEVACLGDLLIDRLLLRVQEVVNALEVARPRYLEYGKQHVACHEVSRNHGPGH